MKSKLRPKSYHSARTGLIALENTHNFAGGSATPAEVFDEVCDRAHEIGLPVHLDGARIFNASAALGIPVDRLTAKADSVMFCLSKGLGAPVGSMLVGSAELIDRGRIYRKALGGGMRQAGILAAAGLIALEEGPTETSERSCQCEVSGGGIVQDSWIQNRPAKIHTNIVICDITATRMNSGEISCMLAGHRVLANGVGPEQIRFVTHLDVTREQCAQALEIVSSVIEARSLTR